MDGGADADNVSIKRLPAEALPVLNEGIYLVLSRWSTLQLAIENEWGSRRSRHLADQLASDVFAWEFLMSIYGLGVKTVECILLLTLQQKAFPAYVCSFKCNCTYRIVSVTVGAS